MNRRLPLIALLSLVAGMAVLAPTASARTVTEISPGAFTVNDPTTIAVDPSGTYAYVNKASGIGGASPPSDSVQVIDMATKTIVAEISLAYSGDHFDANALAVSPNGQWLYVSTGQLTQYVLIIDLRAASPTYRQIVQGVNAPGARSLVFGADGTAYGSVPSSRRAYSITGTPPTAALDMNLDIYSGWSCIPASGPIALGPNDTTLFVPCLSGARQNRIARIQLGVSPTPNSFEFLVSSISPYNMGISGLAFDPTRTTMYGTVSLHDEVAKFPNPGAYASGSTQSNVASVSVGDNPQVLGVDPTGNLLVVLNYTGGTVSVIKTATFAVDETIPLATGTPSALAFTPTGTLALVPSYTGDKIYVIDLDNAQPTPTPAPAPDASKAADSSKAATAAAGSPTKGGSSGRTTFMIKAAPSGGAVIAQRIATPGAGVVRMAGTTDGVSGAACNGRRAVRSASTVWVQCTLTTAARAALAHTSLRVRVKTTFTARGGGSSSRVRYAVVAQRGTPAPPVTG